MGWIDLDRPGAATTADVGGWAGRIRGLLREPLLHFFAVGLVLFLAGQAWRTEHDQRRIVVTPERAAAIAEKYRLQFGAAPSAGELEQAIRQYVREEALYREGRAMGVDRDDEVVRRRIAQKVEFLVQDRSLPREPSEARLHAWFDAHAQAYATPVRTSFVQLYFSPDRPDAEGRAARALAALQGGAAADTVDADPFPDQSAYAQLTAVEARRIFGDSDLARRIDTAPAGGWSGPYRSGYGWHLVRVDAREAANHPSFEAVRDQVHQDYMSAAQDAANKAALDRLVDRYQVVREDGR